MKVQTEKPTITFAAVLLVTLSLISQVALSQVPDFAHPNSPHLMGKNAFAGLDQLDQLDSVKVRLGELAVLTLLVEFPDSPHNPEHGMSYFEDLIFDPDTSVNGYFAEVSYGKFSPTNAGITDWVMAPEQASYYFSSDQSDNQYPTIAADAVEALLATGFSFTPFDNNADGKIIRDELVILLILADHPPLGMPNVMATRRVQGVRQGVTALDGLEIDTWAVRLEENLYQGGEVTKFKGFYVSYFAHEMGHLMLALPDLYGDEFGEDPTGFFSIMATSGAVYTPHVSPWAKIHLGWIQPTVVTKSGYYSIRASEKYSEAYILYNPDHGEKEYYIIENRWPWLSAYESIACPPPSTCLLPDAGLAIWHITEYYDEEPFNFLKGRKMIGMKWAGGAQSLNVFPFTALWDCSESPSCYDFTDDSTPRNARWADGSASGIKIIDISAAGEVMGIYFSVPTAVQAPSAPILSEPLNNATGISTGPIFKYQGSGAETYRLQVSTTSTFSTTFFDQDGITATEYGLSGLLNNTTYFWRLYAINEGGTSLWSEVRSFTTEMATSVEQLSADLPYDFRLDQNYPNPFNPGTTIEYKVRSTSRVRIRIFNVIGEPVRNLVDEIKKQGVYRVLWDGKDGGGRSLPSGAYYYQLTSGSYAAARRMILLK